MNDDAPRDPLWPTLVTAVLMALLIGFVTCGCARSNPAATPRAAKRAMGDTPAPAAAGIDRAPANESPPFVAPLGPPVCTEEESRDPNSPCYVPPVRSTEDPAMVRGKRGFEPRTGGAATDDQLAIDAEQDRAIRELLGDSFRVRAALAKPSPWWHTAGSMVLGATAIIVLGYSLYGLKCLLSLILGLFRRKTHATLPS